MYDHERSLVKRLANRPFALVGVNIDTDLKEIQNIVREKNLIWRSFWDGDYQITKSYGISGFPTIMLIDQNGVIRSIDPGRGKKLDEAIDELLAQM